MTDNRKKAGIALGALFGIMHTLWVLAVGLGFGQTIVNVLESGHFLSSTYSTTAFEPVSAGLGIISAVATGYAVGWTFVYLNNFVGRKLD